MLSSVVLPDELRQFQGMLDQVRLRECDENVMPDQVKRKSGTASVLGDAGPGEDLK
jgi:hypothetical protein